MNDSHSHFVRYLYDKVVCVRVEYTLRRTYLEDDGMFLSQDGNIPLRKAGQRPWMVKFFSGYPVLIGQQRLTLQNDPGH